MMPSALSILPLAPGTDKSHSLSTVSIRHAPAECVTGYAQCIPTLRCAPGYGMDRGVAGYWWVACAPTKGRSGMLAGVPKQGRACSSPAAWLNTVVGATGAGWPAGAGVQWQAPNAAGHQGLASRRDTCACAGGRRLNLMQHCRRRLRLRCRHHHTPAAATRAGSGATLRAAPTRTPSPTASAVLRPISP